MALIKVSKATTQVMPNQLNGAIFTSCGSQLILIPFFYLLTDMLLNLIELRTTDWGRAPTTPSPQIPPVYAPPLSSKGRGGYQGVLYGPDGGKMLTAEERDFLKQSGVHLDDDEDDYEYVEL